MITSTGQGTKISLNKVCEDIVWLSLTKCDILFSSLHCWAWVQLLQYNSRVNSQSGLRFFPLEITVAKSAPITTHKKVANHGSRNKRHIPEINKPQARISGVEISMCYPIDSNTCIAVTTHVDMPHVDSCLRLQPGSLKITWFWDLTIQVCMEGSGTHSRWNQPGFSFSCTLPPGSRFHHS
jgi:hypothetical protein